MTQDLLPKLGKKPARPVPALRGLRDYVRLAVAKVMPPIPTTCDRSAYVQAWPMMDNDVIGDCTIAAVGHAVQLWTTMIGEPRVMTKAEAVTGYERFGYVPGDESTDQGAVAGDVLTSWMQQGFTIAGATDKLNGFCQLAETADGSDVRAGVAWLGVVYAGVALPLAVQGAASWEISADQVLEGAYAAGSWGGHAIPIVGYSPKGLTCVTWGKTLFMNWAFWDAYMDECFGLLSRDFVSTAASDAEINWDALEGDMQDLKEGVA